MYRYGLHHNVLLEMMMSVLQEIEELTRELYFIITQYGSTVYIGIAMGCPAL